jgi:hypothetical protein
MKCSCCGTVAEVRDVDFRLHIGAIVVMIQHYKAGRMCSHCTNTTYWTYTLTTLFLGWWGILSFFITPFVVVMNTITYCCVFLSPPYPEDPLPIVLSSTLVTALEPCRNEIFQRIIKGQKLQEIAEDIGTRVGASSEEVLAFYNNTYSVKTISAAEAPQSGVRKAEPCADADRPREQGPSSHNIKPA